MNRRGEIAGAAKDATGAPQAFLWTPELGFRFVPFDDPPLRSVASVISDEGWVAGGLVRADGVHSFAWSPQRGYVELGTGPENHARVRGFGPDGMVLGYEYLPAEGRYVPRFAGWEDTWQPLEGFEGLLSPLRLTPDGLLFGNCHQTSSWWAACVFQDGKRIDFGPLPAPHQWASVWGRAGNGDFLEVLSREVGANHSLRSETYLFTGGEHVRLLDLAANPHPFKNLTRGAAINSRGVIGGQGYRVDSQLFGFVAFPVPDGR
jgi:hypothetical protein